LQMTKILLRATRRRRISRNVKSKQLFGHVNCAFLALSVDRVTTQSLWFRTRTFRSSANSSSDDESK
jgi:hypothetical protein